MKKYTIHYNYYATADVEVVANSEEEAIKKAREIDIPSEDYDYSLNEESIIDTQDIDPKGCISQAENFLRNDGDTICELGYEIQVECNDENANVRSATWDETENQIVVVFDDYTEHLLSDLSPDCILDVCEAIIDVELNENEEEEDD